MIDHKTRKAPGAVCEKCPIYNKRVAHTTGPKDAKIAVVSRSPGYKEAITGKSFSGPSGRVLYHLLVKQGVKREEILTTNVVLGQSEGPEDPNWNMAVACCAPRLEIEIQDCET